MPGRFELQKSKNGKFNFLLKAANDEVILKSEMYESKTSAEQGIASVRANCGVSERYERKSATDGRFFFNLKAANHQIVGTSQMYSTAQARDGGIASVMANGATEAVKESHEKGATA